MASITDHDCISGYCAVRETLANEGVRLVAGVEFSTSLDNKEMHILGYFPWDKAPEELKEFICEIHASREARILQGLRGLRAKGVNLTLEKVLEQKNGEIISRSHVARAMIKSRIVKNFQEAFGQYLGNEVGIFPASRHKPQEVIEFIKSADGMPVWAHPAFDDFDNRIKDLVEAGLAGVEVSSRHATPTQAQYLETVSGDFGLHVTFGSDWHGYGPEPIKGFTVKRQRIKGFLEELGA